MDVVFPFMDISANELIAFIESEKTLMFIEVEKGEYEYEESFFSKRDGFLRDSLGDFENETVDDFRNFQAIFDLIEDVHLK